MAIISGVTVNWNTSPRIIILPAGVTDVSIEDLQDTLLDLEAYGNGAEGMLFDHLRNTSGGENLGGGVSVGLTMELQNAQIAFQPHLVVNESGTVTTTDANGITLTDSTATFITMDVQPGDTVTNLTDGSKTTVITVDSETQLTTFALQGGTDNTYTSGDSYKVFDVMPVEISGGNLVAVDSGDLTIVPIFPTVGNFVTRTTSSSATLLDQSVVGSNALTLAQFLALK